MTRKNTSQRSEFMVPGEGGIKFPQPPGSSPLVRIYLFHGCKRSTGLHWHETHTELLRIDQGVACLELDGVVRVITSRDGTTMVRRGVRHQYWRADRDLRSGEDAEEQRNKVFGLEDVDEEELAKDLIVIESTDPADLDKEVYFRQILSLLEEKKGNALPETLWMLWSFFVVFCGHDNFPVLVKGSRRFGDGVGKRVEWIFTHTVLALATLFGKLVGLRSTYDEYTPVELRVNGERVEQKGE